MLDALKEKLQTGLKHHQAGELAEAEKIYREIIQMEPNYPDAHHLLGMLAFQFGKHQAALQHLHLAIKVNPKAAHYHNNLGNVYAQLGENERAMWHCQQAIALNTDFAEAHNNLANQYLNQQRYEEAIAHYQHALNVKPDYLEAHNNLANALEITGDLAGAIAHYQKAIEIYPNSPEVHNNLGSLLQNQGQLEPAITHYQAAIQLNPDFPEAHNNLGLTYQTLNQNDEAFKSFREAIRLRPQFHQAHFNLGNIWLIRGDLEKAREHFQTALRLNPDYQQAKKNLELLEAEELKQLGNQKIEQENYAEALIHFQQVVRLNPNDAEAWFNAGSSCLKLNLHHDALNCYFQAVLISPATPEFQHMFIQLLDLMDTDLLLENESALPKLLEQLHLSFELGFHRSKVLRIMARILKTHPDTPEAVALLQQQMDNPQLLAQSVLQRVIKNPLFLCILEHGLIAEETFENLFTLFRKWFLLHPPQEANILPFISALAHQCFTNEYIYALDTQEHEAIESLKNELEQAPTTAKLTIYAMYHPLNSLQRVVPIPEDVNSPFFRLWKQQIQDPQEEAQLQQNIKILTPIEDQTSLRVKAQYEENPYPRWVQENRLPPQTLYDFLRQGFPHFTPPDFTQQPFEMLVAGCGTGQEVVENVFKFQNLKKILAVDMSTSSLAYAMRKAKELDLTQIDFYQGDILQLDTIKQQFPMISCSGVLHHMKSPQQGLEILLKCLKPFGIMKIGLYSTSARRYIHQLRDMIQQKRLEPTPENIRQFRQLVYQMDDQELKQSITNFGDFYSMSTCRDLLFHVQEHTFDLLEVQDMLSQLNLRFIGFQHPLGELLRQQFKTHSAQEDMTNLNLWHQFEQQFPHTFGGMYQFFVTRQEDLG